MSQIGSKPLLQRCIPAGISWCMQAKSLCSCCHLGLLRYPLLPRLQHRHQLAVIPAVNQAVVGGSFVMALHQAACWLFLQLLSGQPLLLSA